ncbi:MAG: prolipoprotein diacylglyceryl transferase [Leadbetterella sp.]
MDFAYIIWDFDPTILKLGENFQIRWYGLLWALGFLVGYQIIAKVFSIEKKDEKDLDSLLLTMILSIVLGARIGHYVFYEHKSFGEDPVKFVIDMLMPPYEGLASHGAAFGVLIGILIYKRIRPQYDYLWLTDRLVIVCALGGAFIRFANFLNSEIVGKPSNLPWAVYFKRNDMEALVPRHPAQLYESITCLLLTGVLVFLYSRWKANTPRGSLTAIFFIWVFVLRFFFEFLKENQSEFENGMTFNMGQLLSIPVVLFGIYALVSAIRNRNLVS